MTSLASAIRSTALSAPEITRLTSLRRSTALFSQDQAADSVYLIEEGLVKLSRTNAQGSRIILTIRGAGELVGEEALAETRPPYSADAEVLVTATLDRIPRDVLSRAIASNAELASSVITYLLERRLALAQKVELLCLHDVEYRILHYLAELSHLVQPMPDEQGHAIPITQLELADLIGATRETTSTTLNQLERRGLIKLSRRMMIVPSPSSLQSAALARVKQESRPTPSSSRAEAMQ